MTSTELSALIVAIASVAAVVLLSVALVSITKTLAEVRRTVELLRTEAMPVVTDLADTVRTANEELVRMDGILGTAENIGGTVDAASRLAYLTFSNPIIKALAFASGTGRAARAFRRTRNP